MNNCCPCPLEIPSNVAKGMPAVSFQPEFRLGSASKNWRVLGLERWSRFLWVEAGASGRPRQCRRAALTPRCCSVSLCQRPAGSPAGPAHPAAARPGRHVRRQHHCERGVRSCLKKSRPALRGRTGSYCREEERKPRRGAPANHRWSRWDSVQAPSAVSTLAPLPFAVCSFTL